MTPLERLLQDQVDAGTLPGAVAVHHRREGTETVAVGAQDLDTRTPMSPQTLFFWDSLGKPLTAALALIHVADGQLDLDAPIEQWLPELADPQVLADPNGPLTETVAAHRPVTVEDLLTLRGGLGFTSDFESPFTAALVEQLQAGPDPCPLDRDEFLASAGRLPLAHQPGQGWTYNTGSTLLGMLLERLTGQPLDVLMAERLLDPLGIADTMWWVPPAELPRFASRYASTGDAAEPLQRTDPADGLFARPQSFPDGAGGLIGTAGDWLTFGAMLLASGRHQGRQILPAELVASMMSDHLTEAQRRQAGIFLDPGEGWGYGGSVRADGSYGWAGGAGTTARVDPRRGEVTILLTQVGLDGPQGAPHLTSFEDHVRAAR